MVNSKDILAALQAGKSADEIAQELVNALNDANAEYAAAQKAAEEKARKEKEEAEKAAAADAERDADIQAIGEHIVEYIHKWYPNSEVCKMLDSSDLDCAGAAQMIDEFIQQMEMQCKHLNHLKRVMGNLFGDVEPNEVEVKNAEEAVDALHGFLKANGLL